MGLATRGAACRWSSSATSTAAGCSPRSTAPSRSCRRPTSGWSPASWSTSSAATSGCCSPGSTSSPRSPAGPTLGVLPWLAGLELDVEDSLGLDAAARPPGRPHGEDVLRVVGGPAAPAVQLHRPRRAGRRAGRAASATPPAPRSWPTPTSWCCPAPAPPSPTSAGCARPGWPTRCCRRAAAGGPVLGICGGHQMLARTITDDVESRAGDGARARTAARRRPVRAGEDARPAGRRRARAAGARLRDPPRRGHRRRRRGAVPRRRPRGLGVRARPGTARWRTTASAGPSSPRSRRLTGRRFVVAPDTDFAAVREARLDRLGDLVAEHADTDALWRLIEAGAARRACRSCRPASDRGEPRLQRARGCRRATAWSGPASVRRRCCGRRTAARSPTRMVNRTVTLVRPSFSVSASTVDRVAPARGRRPLQRARLHHGLDPRGRPRSQGSPCAAHQWLDASSAQVR